MKMEVSIKRFDVEMSIKNNGIELDVSDTKGNHLGDLVITKTKVEWCKGRTAPKNGLTWTEFIAVMEKNQ
jgi:hypothetical protein